MATTNYNFETMTQTDAEAFTAGDTLIFTNGTPADVTVVNTSLDGLAVTAGGKTLTFTGAVLSDASDAGLIKFTSSFNAGHDNSLVLGHQTSDSLSIGSNDDGNYAYGFGGDDTIVGGNGNNVIYGGDGDDSLAGGDRHDNLFGGAGDDHIDGGAGNDHIYGFDLVGDPTGDGNDVLSGGDGNDYIQGNAGTDLINGDDGNDRLNGGADDDTINGGNDSDTINGNKGDDLIHGDGGNDSLRGGQGNDEIHGDGGYDVLLGDLGDDTLAGGANADILTGGDGADVFSFATGDAVFDTSGDFANFTDTITDFTSGDDLIQIAGVTDSTTILYAGEGFSVSTFTAAQSYANTLLAGHTGTDEVVALNVGSDTYLFYNSAHTGDTADSAILLTGVNAADITIDNFAV
jgi:serralysin